MAMGKINKRKNKVFMPAVPQENVDASSFLNKQIKINLKVFNLESLLTNRALSKLSILLVCHRPMVPYHYP